MFQNWIRRADQYIESKWPNWKPIVLDSVGYQRDDLTTAELIALILFCILLGTTIP